MIEELSKVFGNLADPPCIPVMDQCAHNSLFDDQDCCDGSKCKEQGPEGLYYCIPDSSDDEQPEEVINEESCIQAFDECATAFGESESCCPNSSCLKQGPEADRALCVPTGYTIYGNECSQVFSECIPG